MARKKKGWKLIKRLTPDETADVRARMGLDVKGLRRSRESDLADLDEEILRLLREDSRGLP